MNASEITSYYGAVGILLVLVVITFGLLYSAAPKKNKLRPDAPVHKVLQYAKEVKLIRLCLLFTLMLLVCLMLTVTFAIPQQ